MPLPAGFKVNGTKTTGKELIPPRAIKIMGSLNALPFGDLITSNELSVRVSLSIGGAWSSLPCLVDYREKIDNKHFWGSRKSIAHLRKQLAKSEETNEKD